MAYPKSISYYFAAALYVIFLIIPGTSGLYDGIPLNNFYELIAIALLPALFIALPRGTKKVDSIHWVAIVLIIGKIAIGQASLQEGLVGSYYSLNGKTKILERSTEFFKTIPDATRVDRAIDFEQEGKKIRPFPVWFFNTKGRLREDAQDARLTPFSAEWKGYLHVPKGGMSLTHQSDGLVTIQAPMPQEEAVIPIAVSYTASAVPHKSLTLEWQNGEIREPILNSFYRIPYTASQIRAHGARKTGDILIKIIALLLALTLMKERFGAITIKKWFFSWQFWLFISYAATILLVFNGLSGAAQSSYFGFLDKGNDPLTYESYARHIAFTGDWSMRTLETGSYYYQPYYYFVALFHYIGGEGILPVLGLQGIALAAAGIFLAIIGSRLVGYPIDTRNTVRKLWPLLLLAPLIAKTALIRNESLLLFPSIMGVCAAAGTGALLLAGKNREKGKRNWLFFLAGITLGFGVMSRFNFLGWIPFVCLWIVIIFKKRCIPPLIIFLLGAGFVIGPMMARNKIVSHYWQIVSRSNATINFLQSLPAEAASYSGNYDHYRITQITDTLFDVRATPGIEWIMDHKNAYLRSVMAKAIKTVEWFPWQYAFFLIGSTAWLFKPSLLSPYADRRDYIIIGIFPILQSAGVIIMSANTERYHASSMAYMALWAPLIAIMIQNVITSRYLLWRQAPKNG